MRRSASRSLTGMVGVAAAIAVAGLVGMSNAIAEQPDFSIGAPQAWATAQEGSRGGGLAAATVSRPQSIIVGAADEGVVPETVDRDGSAQGSSPAARMDILLQKGQDEVVEYDPWEPYNETMFSFNHRVVDRYILKPVATAWDTIMPDPFQRSLANVFDNLGMPRRGVNNLLQLKFKRAGYELTRFILNTTIGVGGIFDIAKEGGIDRSDEDTGQTLGVYGVGPGPYLILPVLPPLTVRDGVGFVVDAALDPLNYVLPFAATAGRTVGNTVNDRSLNLELFQSVEENTLDLYSAVRNGYLQRRQRAIEE
ncbi:MAG: MlaA family lipoprotein [Candidatus Methylomirabilis sp.]